MVSEELIALSFFDPYQAYVEGSVFSGNPLSTVIALYEGTIDSIRQARTCFETGDIRSRGKAINKATSLVTELIASLDHEKGGEVAANLKRIYSYIQCRILHAHSHKTAAPLFEAEKLMETMLEGWREASDKLDAEQRGNKAAYTNDSSYADTGFAYGFLSEPMPAAGICATF